MREREKLSVCVEEKRVVETGSCIFEGGERRRGGDWSFRPLWRSRQK